MIYATGNKIVPASNIAGPNCVNFTLAILLIISTATLRPVSTSSVFSLVKDIFTLPV
jgi:hypothetical protein